MKYKENMGDFLFLAITAITLIIVLFPDAVDVVIESMLQATSKVFQLFDECATQYLIFRGNVMMHQEMKEEKHDEADSRSGETSGE